MTENESTIRNAIRDYLRYNGYVCKRTNAGYMLVTGPYGKKRAITIGEEGWPDIEGMLSLKHGDKAGQYFGIEVKTRTGKLRPAQVEMQERITKSKGIYLVARSVQDVIDAGF